MNPTKLKYSEIDHSSIESMAQELNNDYERFPIPFLMDPIDELKALHKREDKIYEFCKRFYSIYKLTNQ